MVFLGEAGFFVPLDATTFFVGAVVTTAGCLVGVATIFVGGVAAVGFLVGVDALAAPFLVGVGAFTDSFLLGVDAITDSFLVGVEAMTVSFLVGVEATTVSFLVGVEAPLIGLEATGSFVASSIPSWGGERLCIDRPKTWPSSGRVDLLAVDAPRRRSDDNRKSFMMLICDVFCRACFWFFYELLHSLCLFENGAVIVF